MTNAMIRRVLREPARRKGRALANGGDRRHLRRAHRRARCRRRSVTRIPTESEMRTVSALRFSDVVGQAVVGGLEERVDTPGEQQAADEPEERGEHADDERLERHGREQLPARGADRPQGRELADALRDRDRERVEDDERADEERDRARTRAGSSG